MTGLSNTHQGTCTSVTHPKLLQDQDSMLSWFKNGPTNQPSTLGRQLQAQIGQVLTRCTQA